MPLDQIRSLASQLFNELTKERVIDAQTGYELGRVAAVLEMLGGKPSGVALPERPAVTQSVTDGASAPLPASIAQAPAHSNGKRARVEKRPMRHAERILEGPDGRKVVYNFERLDLRDSIPGSKVRVETVGSRKELWDRLKKQKKEFRRAMR